MIVVFTVAAQRATYTGRPQLGFILSRSALRAVHYRASSNLARVRCTLLSMGLRGSCTTVTSPVFAVPFSMGLRGSCTTVSCPLSFVFCCELSPGRTQAHMDGSRPDPCGYACQEQHSAGSSQIHM